MSGTATDYIPADGPGSRDAPPPWEFGHRRGRPAGNGAAGAPGGRPAAKTPA
jgi:hypothetical protein